mgnify:CR=1 FL=1
MGEAKESRIYKNSVNSNPLSVCISFISNGNVFTNLSMNFADSYVLCSLLNHKYLILVYSIDGEKDMMEQ